MHWGGKCCLVCDVINDTKVKTAAINVTLSWNIFQQWIKTLDRQYLNKTVSWFQPAGWCSFTVSQPASWLLHCGQANPTKWKQWPPLASRSWAGENSSLIVALLLCSPLPASYIIPKWQTHSVILGDPQNGRSQLDSPLKRTLMTVCQVRCTNHPLEISSACVQSIFVFTQILSSFLQIKPAKEKCMFWFMFICAVYFRLLSVCLGKVGLFIFNFSITPNLILSNKVCVG